MPMIFTPTPAETERKASGIGGEPPVFGRPTGGGGGGGDDDRNRKGPRELLYRTRAFLFCALAGDMMFFLSLATVFYPRQSSASMGAGAVQQAGSWHPALLPPILFLNAAVLLLSCLTMEIARRHIFREIDVMEEWLGLGQPALRRTMPWLLSTLALGALFIIGQVVACQQLSAQGLGFNKWSTPAIGFFYVIAGIHAAHLAFGLLGLLICIFVLGRLKHVEHRQITVDAVAWFWHAMGLAWLVLFAILVF